MVRNQSGKRKEKKKKLGAKKNESRGRDSCSGREEALLVDQEWILELLLVTTEKVLHGLVFVIFNLPSVLPIRLPDIVQNMRLCIARRSQPCNSNERR
jgi:hypothetical protein